MLSPTPPTRVPLNKEGVTCIGRPRTIATRVYIGTATATWSQFQLSKLASTIGYWWSQFQKFQNEGSCKTAATGSRSALCPCFFVVEKTSILSAICFRTTDGRSYASRLLNNSCIYAAMKPTLARAHCNAFKQCNADFCTSCRGNAADTEAIKYPSIRQYDPGIFDQD